MAYTRSKQCSHDSCIRFPEGGAVTDALTSACVRHMSDLPFGLAINFPARREGTGCQKRSKWGIEGKQPTHCPDHGGLVRTVGETHKKKPRSSPGSAVTGRSIPRKKPRSRSERSATCSWTYMLHVRSVVGAMPVGVPRRFEVLFSRFSLVLVVGTGC